MLKSFSSLRIKGNQFSCRTRIQGPVISRNEKYLLPTRFAWPSAPDIFININIYQHKIDSINHLLFIKSKHIPTYKIDSIDECICWA